MASCGAVVGLLLLCVSFVVAQDGGSLLTAYDSESYIGLKILEIRKMQRESSPSGREYNVQVLLATHDSITGLETWSLTVLTNSSESSTTTTIPSLDPMQTELEFEADLTNGTAMFVEGVDTNNIRVAMAYHLIDARVMNSRLAWVGGPYDPVQSSLRVWPGSMKEVMIGAEVCKSDDAPCYFLEGAIPLNIPRCQDSPSPREGTVVNQCDEVITNFQETEEEPKLKIRENNLTVSIKLRSTPAKIEAVVYNPEDTSQVFSPRGYSCWVEVSTLRTDQEVVCYQRLQQLDDLKEPMVLVVAIDHDGYVHESRQGLYKEGSSPSNDNTELIVGCVVGGICLVALIVALVVFIMKDKKSKGKSKSKKSAEGEKQKGGDTKYEAAPISEPPIATEEERVES